MVDVCRLHGIWLDGGELFLVVANSRRNPVTRIDQETREDALRREMIDSMPPEPSLASLLQRRLVKITRRVVSMIRGA